jgi:hypothetical protein
MLSNTYIRYLGLWYHYIYSSELSSASPEGTRNRAFLLTVSLTLLARQKPLTRQSIVLCDQCVQQLTLATNVFKQHTESWPLILAALTNSGLFYILPHNFPLFPSAWGHKAESQTLLTCKCTVITIPTFIMYVQTLQISFVVKYLE